MQTIGKIIFSIGLAVSSIFGFHQTVTPSQVFGSSFTPVEASQFTLSGAGITSSASTIQLNSFKLPDPNHTPITMSMFGDIGYAVLEPQTSKIENITFTGVTQNANGTALLTGVTRGISFYSPYQASTTLRLSHAGGAYLILTNSAAFYGKEFLFANNTGTSTAVVVLSSTTPWRYDGHPTFTLGTQLIDKTYADALSFNAVATATETSFGGVWLATQLQQASSTNGSPNSPFVLQSRYATSSPGTNAGLDIVITQNNGKINQNFFDLTQIFTLSGGLVSSASTTILANSSNKVSFNGLSYIFPSVRGASSTVLSENGSGTLSWESAYPVVLLNTYDGTTITSAGTTTARTLVLPVNTLTTIKSIRGHVTWGYSAVIGSATTACGIDFGNGNSTTTIAFTLGSVTGGSTDFTIYATSTSAQTNVSQSYSLGNSRFTSPTILYGVRDTSFSTTGLLYLGFNCAAGGSDYAQLNSLTVEQLSQ